MSKEKITINVNYSKSIIEICKLLKSHATNIMLLPNNLIMMQPIIDGIRNYMILNSTIDYSDFLYSYFSIPELSKINSKFRKTKSSISFENDHDTKFIVIDNSGDNYYKFPVFDNQNVIEDMIKRIYDGVPDFTFNTLSDVLDSEFIPFSNSFIERMIDKHACEFSANNHTIMISKPLLGNLKKTEFVGYRVIAEDNINGKIIIQFKQKEDIGNIYTYAAFMIV